MENGLQKIWIIDKAAGISIFDQSFEDLPDEINNDLVGGFFIAMMSFSEEIAKQQIDFLQLKQSRFYFYIMKKYVLILATVNKISQDHAGSIATQIQIRFEEKYQKIIENQFSGDVSVFNNFAVDVEEILQKPSIAYSNFEGHPEELENYYKSSKQRWETVKSQIRSLKFQFNHCDSDKGDVCLMKTHIAQACGKFIESVKSHKKKSK